MRAVPTPIGGVVVVEAPVRGDARGFFVEVFHADKFAGLGLPTAWAQDNHSRSARHVLRGLHFQREQPQGKLVRPTSGVIWDVAVDLRRGSRTYGRWYGVTLEAGDGRQLYIPPGLAHGFVVLSDAADVSYKCTTPYHAASDGAVLWSDPTLGVEWPLPAGVAPLVSARDAAAPPLAQIEPFG